MITINETNYPIISVHFENVATLEDTEKYLSRFGNWLLHEHQFGIIIRQSNSQEKDTDQVAAVHQLIVQWIKQNKSKIAQFCVGIALVIDTAETLENRRKTAPKTITAIYGCPGQVFETQTEAQQWIQQQM